MGIETIMGMFLLGRGGEDSLSCSEIGSRGDLEGRFLIYLCL